MSRTKKFVKKVDFIEAYQVDPKSRDRDTLQMNQSDYYEPAYHGMITTSHVSWVEPGDYVIKLPNDIWMAMKKKEFEAMYEPMDTEEKIVQFLEETPAPKPEDTAEEVEEPETVVAKKPSPKKKSYKD